MLLPSMQEVLKCKQSCACTPSVATVLSDLGAEYFHKSLSCHIVVLSSPFFPPQVQMQMRTAGNSGLLKQLSIADDLCCCTLSPCPNSNPIASGFYFNHSATLSMQ